MNLFTLSVTETADGSALRLYSALIDEISLLHKGFRQINLTRVEYLGNINIVCSDNLEEVFTDHLPPYIEPILEKTAIALATYIIIEMEQRLIRDIIVKEYNYTDAADYLSIEQYCCNIQRDLNQTASGNGMIKCREKLSDEIRLYLKEHTWLNLDGFIRFRMRAYIDQLREIVDYAIDEFLMEKQYQEFIALLKYFVYIQEAKIPIAHLMHRGEDEFTLLNEKMQPIEARQLDQMVIDLPDQDVKYEEIIVSTLITVSPQRIYIHTRDPEKQIIKTIRQIFDDRSELCTYCSKCKPFLGEVGVAPLF